MNAHTDSHIIEHNDDGSRTETTIVTYGPVTKTQQALAWTGLIAICVAPVAPLAVIAYLDRREEKKAEKRRLKLAEQK